jgi:hypothetical protein
MMGYPNMRVQYICYSLKNPILNVQYLRDLMETFASSSGVLCRLKTSSPGQAVLETFFPFLCFYVFFPYLCRLSETNHSRCVPAQESTGFAEWSLEGPDSNQGLLDSIADRSAAIEPFGLLKSHLSLWISWYSMEVCWRTLTDLLEYLWVWAVLLI